MKGFTFKEDWYRATSALDEIDFGRLMAYCAAYAFDGKEHEFSDSDNMAVKVAFLFIKAEVDEERKNDEEMQKHRAEVSTKRTLAANARYANKRKTANAKRVMQMQNDKTHLHNNEMQMQNGEMQMYANAQDNSDAPVDVPASQEVVKVAEIPVVGADEKDVKLSDVNRENERERKADKERESKREHTLLQDNIDRDKRVVGGKEKMAPVKSIEDRKKEFHDLLNDKSRGTRFRANTDELKKFYEYWTEANDNGKKMRFEMQPVFDINKRLATWFGNVEARNIRAPAPASQARQFHNATAPDVYDDKIT